MWDTGDVTEVVAASAEKAILVAGGPLEKAEAARLADAVTLTRQSGGRVIGVDGGAYHLLRLGTLPDIVTGDFDSLDAADRDDLARRGVRIVPTPDQDYTDLDKSLAFVQSEGASHIRVYAATGGRLDHVFSVLSAVVKHGRAADVRLVDAVGETWLLNGAQTLSGPDLPGRTLSLIALGRVTGVVTTGVRWPLTGEDLAPGVRDGTLNEIVAETVLLRAASGDLLINLHHPPSEPAEE